MAQLVKFTKMHGAGNDYIYVDTTAHPLADPARCARLWSDRHKGIGSDGLVLIGRADGREADFTMRIFNADGSEAMMCGNASRCVGKYLYDRHITTQTQIRLLTLSGVKLLCLSTNGGTVNSVSVDMLKPALACAQQFAPTGHELPVGTFVSMGNPHYVMFTGDVQSVDVARLGPQLECHPAFPQRCNIEFAQVLADGRVRARVWERGSGITMACGTGACAVAVATHVRGLAPRQVRVVMDGGELQVSWRASDDHVLLSGEAQFVFDGEVAVP